MTTVPEIRAVRAKDRLQRHDQRDAYSSPWSLGTRVKMAVWTMVWTLLFRPTPKPARAWRIFLLRLFGAQINGSVYVAASTIIKVPWNLRMEHRACLGPGVELYNLAPVTVGEAATVAQHAYFCGGTHDLADPALPLLTGPIEIGANAFIGAKAFLMPGVVVGEGAVVGACSVVIDDVPAWMVCAGNPCKPIRKREVRKAQEEHA